MYSARRGCVRFDRWLRNHPAYRYLPCHHNLLQSRYIGAAAAAREAQNTTGPISPAATPARVCIYDIIIMFRRKVHFSSTIRHGHALGRVNHSVGLTIGLNWVGSSLKWDGLDGIGEK